MYLSHLTVLRGLAILFILLFHLNAQIFPNGYLGVEAFLVISGFLLFRSFAEKGYFDTETANNVLMHTWYIGVTLQLCLIYIIPAALIGKFSKKAAGVLFGCIGCASLGYAGLCISGILPGQESSLYYSTAARIWEAFSGAVVLFIPTTKLLQGRKKEMLTFTTIACMTLLALCLVQLPMYAAAPAMVICSIVFITYAGDSCILRTTVMKQLILLGNISVRERGSLSRSAHTKGHLP